MDQLVITFFQNQGPWALLFVTSLYYFIKFFRKDSEKRESYLMDASRKREDMLMDFIHKLTEKYDLMSHKINKIADDVEDIKEKVDK